MSINRGEIFYHLMLKFGLDTMDIASLMNVPESVVYKEIADEMQKLFYFKNITNNLNFEENKPESQEFASTGNGCDLS